MSNFFLEGNSMSIVRKFALLLAAALLAACGGGSPEPEAFSPQVMKAAAPQAATTVTLAAAAELLLNTGESAYHSLFPVHKTTQTSGPFVYRYYPETGMYLGVVILPGSAYTLNGVYVVGPGFGTLANPTYVGPLTNFVNVTIDTGLSTGRTLTVSVTAAGFTSPPVTLTNVPLPNTQADFCSGLAADTTFTQIAAGAGGSMTINSCSFNGTTGHITATMTIVYGTFQQTLSYTITYTYS
jgi:hypothetical protein